MKNFTGNEAGMSFIWTTLTAGHGRWIDIILVRMTIFREDDEGAYQRQALCGVFQDIFGKLSIVAEDVSCIHLQLVTRDALTAATIPLIMKRCFQIHQPADSAITTEASSDYFWSDISHPIVASKPPFLSS